MSSLKIPFNVPARFSESNMKKNIFIKSTIILILGGVITKILGFMIRLIYTRIVGPEVIGLYSIIFSDIILLLFCLFEGCPS